ncbi:hypothetical protein NHP190012_01860 [Helicobacter sp. NHP19-012]|uniref:Lipoprotein n=1 Tax=Helicobacter gastrofelis TaxID=2849642 RepID=A0ABM7SLN7_9HELI|nr:MULTISPECIES: hypothetical protein [unclassified Helicobacter]BCZ18544.1 hypothetical protein NHP190012_01860 [Helicobacter sp. NHP19-012]GMB95817.1 hypothetical protein NHP22001_04060 [Helicobacter sp. NHP22-001]
MKKHILYATFCTALLMTACTSQSTPTKSAAPSKSTTAKKAPTQSAQQGAQQDQDDDINYERPLIRGKK